MVKYSICAGELMIIMVYYLVLYTWQLDQEIVMRIVLVFMNNNQQ